MFKSESSEQKQRPNRPKKKWPQWLRNHRLLRLIIWIGILMYRICRFILNLFDAGEG